MEIQQRKFSAQCQKRNKANLKIWWSVATLHILKKKKNKPNHQTNLLPKQKMKKKEKSPLFNLINVFLNFALLLTMLCSPTSICLLRL